MPITLTLRKKEYKLEGSITVKKALHMLNLSSESHLVVRDGVLLVETEKLRDGDVVKIISAISGG